MKVTDPEARFGALVDELLIPADEWTTFGGQFERLLKEGLEFELGYVRPIALEAQVKEFVHEYGFEVSDFDRLLDAYRAIAPKARRGLIADCAPPAPVPALPIQRRKQPSRIAC